MVNYYVYATSNTLNTDVDAAVRPHCGTGTGPIGSVPEFHVTIYDGTLNSVANQLRDQFNNKVIHSESYSTCSKYTSTTGNYNVKITTFKYGTGSTTYGHHMNICHGVSNTVANSMIARCQDVKNAIESETLTATKLTTLMSGLYEKEDDNSGNELVGDSAHALEL